MPAGTSTCTSCKAPIVWVRTANGRSMPCDPEVLAVVTDTGEIARGRQSHFASCPNADRHRRPRPAEGGVR